MDLRTFLFNNGISASEFARELGMDRSAFYFVVMRRSRPTRWVPYVIQHMTGGQVTVDEICNPWKYPVVWPGDMARSDCKRNPRPIKPSNGLLRKFKNFAESRNGSSHQKGQEKDRQDDEHSNQEGHPTRQETESLRQDGEKKEE